MHPLVSVAARSFYPDLAGAHVLVAGDALAVRRARQVAGALGMIARRLPRLDLAAYHAAAALVANGAAALAAAGERLLVRGGTPPRLVPRMLGPLLRSVADNVAKLGLPAALTGPVRRGDAEAVRRHLESLKRSAPETLPLYVAGALYQLEMARRLGDTTRARLAAVHGALKERRFRAIHR